MAVDRVRDNDLGELEPSHNTYERMTFNEARQIDIIRKHIGNGRGWCDTCKLRVPDIPSHVAEKLLEVLDIRTKVLDSQRQGFEEDLKAGRLSIMGEYLVASVEECTCDPHHGSHMSGCGYEPVGKLIDIL